MRPLLILALLCPACSGSLVYVREGDETSRPRMRAGNPHAVIHRIYRMARKVGYTTVGSPETTNLKNGKQAQTVLLKRNRWMLLRQGQSVAGDMRRRLAYLRLPESERLRHMRRIHAVVQIWWISLEDQPQAGIDLIPQFETTTEAHPHHREVAFLGRDAHVAWYIYAPIPTWVELQRDQKLTGGSSAVEALVRGLAVKDSGGWTSFSCYDLLGSVGAKALPVVEKLVSKKSPQRGSAIRAIARHPDKRIGARLVVWAGSADAAVAGAARRALVEMPRKRAADLYEKWLAAEGGKKPVLPLLQAIRDVDVRRSVPQLQKVLARPESVGEYLLAFALTREFVGPAIPAVLSTAAAQIIKHGFRGNGREPDTAKVNAAVTEILACKDAEAVAVEGLRLSLFISKGDYRVVREAGLRVLKQVAGGAGLKLVNHLVKTMFGTDLLKMQKIAEIVRAPRAP